MKQHPTADARAGTDTDLFLIPISLLAAALGLCALLLVLQLMPTRSPSGLAADETPVAASLPPCA